MELFAKKTVFFSHLLSDSADVPVDQEPCRYEPPLMPGLPKNDEGREWFSGAREALKGVARALAACIMKDGVLGALSWTIDGKVIREGAHVRPRFEAMTGTSTQHPSNRLSIRPEFRMSPFKSNTAWSPKTAVEDRCGVLRGRAPCPPREPRASPAYPCATLPSRRQYMFRMSGWAPI